MNLSLFLAWIVVALNAISVACEDSTMALLNVERPANSLIGGETRRLRGSSYVYDEKKNTSALIPQQQSSEDGIETGTELQENINTYTDIQGAVSSGNDNIGDSTQLVVCFLLIFSLSALCALAAQYVYGEKPLLADNGDGEKSRMIISPVALI